MEFYEIEPSLENYWRSIILFGRNVASYKFALAKSLYELSSRESDLISLEELAEPFSKHLCTHLQKAPKQITSPTSQFIEACQNFNNAKITKDELLATTKKRGFTNVIDAFHVVNNGDIPKRFFFDERKTDGGIRLTENFYQLCESVQFKSFVSETEARWNLVEHAWNSNISRRLVEVEYDSNLMQLVAGKGERRTNISSCKDSLNGYQKGKCFYCYSILSIDRNDKKAAEVDHFLPWILNKDLANVNGVWNLVLACADCNRGARGKFAKVPSIELLKRLHKRNEYFINSHLPLRETLINQTGISQGSRIDFLQRNYRIAKEKLIHEWQPEIRGSSLF